MFERDEKHSSDPFYSVDIILKIESKQMFAFVTGVCKPGVGGVINSGRVYASTQSLWTRCVSTRRVTSNRRSEIRKYGINMCEPNQEASNESKATELTPTELEKETSVSFWGVASFAIIMAIFAVGILATVARDFVPGGMVGPA